MTKLLLYIFAGFILILIPQAFGDESSHKEVFINKVSVFPGKDWRASQNFSISYPPEAHELVWRISAELHPERTSFGVAEDVSGSDPLIFKSLSDGSHTDIIRGTHDMSRLYLGGVNKGNSPFIVSVYWIRHE